MGKFPFKRPRIIAKKFPQVESSIERVTESLNTLVFSYQDQVDRALQKKHIMMGLSSLTLLIVLGSFISPKGKADSSIFYPDTCLGGWVNPSLAEGEPETTSNADASQFTEKNSAVLPRNTDAEMYCGNFKGTYNNETVPKKILVSLALTKGEDSLLEKEIVSDSFASSSGEILDTASTTDVSFTLSSSTLLVASSTGTSTDDGLNTSTTSLATTTDQAAVTPSLEATTTKTESPESSSVIESVVDSVKDAISTLFGGDSKEEQSQPVAVPVETVPTPNESSPVEVSPEQAPAPAPSQIPETAPTGMLLRLKNSFSQLFFERVFAEEVEGVISLPEETSEVDGPSSESVPIIVATSTEDLSSVTVGTSTDTSSSTETLLQISSTTAATTTEETSSSSNATSTDDGNRFQNNFLEVLYTFDGVEWHTLGTLNEISMKYRTFEIPGSASTTWEDMTKLQIKIVSTHTLEDTPTLYLDGVKVEVFYETTVTHMHPDFARDTILKDEIIDGVRVVTIINSDTKQEEIWYMMLEQVPVPQVPLSSSATTTATTTAETSTTTDFSTSSSSEVVTSTTSSTSPPLVQQESVNLLVKTWKKFEPKSTPEVNGDQTSLQDVVKEIKEKEEKIFIEEITSIPNFEKDTIKKMKGVFAESVIIQVEKRQEVMSTSSTLTPRTELWLFDIRTGVQEKIGQGTSSLMMSIADDTPLGVKGGYVFWLSSQKNILYAYSVAEKSLMMKDVPLFVAENGERASLYFEEIGWTVYISDQGFTFYSPATGEVFSDEDSRIVEDLRTEMNLDTLLTKDELSDLNLPVQEED